MYDTWHDGSNTILSNELVHRTNLSVIIYWWSNSNILFLASNERTSNIEPNRAFSRFTKFLIKVTQTSIFWTLNELAHVHSSKTLFLDSNDRTSNIVQPITNRQMWMWSLAVSVSHNVTHKHNKSFGFSNYWKQMVLMTFRL